jgi:hypothetical protein
LRTLKRGGALFPIFPPWLLRRRGGREAGRHRLDNAGPIEWRSARETLGLA